LRNLSPILFEVDNGRKPKAGCFRKTSLRQV